MTGNVRTSINVILRSVGVTIVTVERYLDTVLGLVNGFGAFQPRCT
jgi:hypothetical protein